MKAIDIITDMVQDADIASYGSLIHFTAESGIIPWFGESAKLAKGDIEIDGGESHYLALWQSVDKTAWFTEEHNADAVIKTNDDTIYLYKIES